MLEIQNLALKFDDIALECALGWVSISTFALVYPQTIFYWGRGTALILFVTTHIQYYVLFTSNSENYPHKPT